MRGVLRTGFIALFPCVLLAAAASAQEAKFLETQGDWSAYTNNGGGKKVCFVISQPKDSAPKNVKRGPIYFYVSQYPADKVRNEISVKMGYPLKQGVPVELAIGDKKFSLFTKAEGAYVEKKATENEIVAAMRAGAEMVVQGRSTRGTLTTDKYSLKGVAGALDRAAKECQ